MIGWQVNSTNCKSTPKHQLEQKGDSNMYRVLISNNYDDLFVNSAEEALEQFITELRNNINNKSNKEIVKYLGIIVSCEKEY